MGVIYTSMFLERAYLESHKIHGLKMIVHPLVICCGPDAGARARMVDEVAGLKISSDWLLRSECMLCSSEAIWMWVKIKDLRGAQISV